MGQDQVTARVTDMDLGPGYWRGTGDNSGYGPGPGYDPGSVHGNAYGPGSAYGPRAAPDSGN